MSSARAGIRGDLTFLFGGQVVGLLAPLITVPYLARVLGPSGWGPVLAAQALANWLILVLEYGFDLSGTRAVARARHATTDLERVVQGVMSAKLLLVPLVVGALLLAFAAVPILHQNAALLPWTLAFAVLRGMSPLWYYQGVERVRGAVSVESVTKGVAAVAVFLVVHGPNDAPLVLALQGIFAGLSVAVLTLRMMRDVRVLPPSWRAAVATLRGSGTIFAYRATGGVYNQASAMILGVYGGAGVVAAFGGAERIVRAAIGLLQPLTQAFLPRVSALTEGTGARAMALVDWCLVRVGGFGLLMGSVGYVGAPLLVRVLLGDEYAAAVPVMRVLAVLIPMVAINTVLGLYWAVPFGRERLLFVAVLAAAVANLLAVAVLVPVWGALGMSAAVILAEGVVMLVLGVRFVRHRAAIRAAESPTA